MSTTRRQRELRGMFVIGVMTLLWLAYVLAWAISAATAPGWSPRLTWGCVIGMLGAAGIAVAAWTCDKWVREGGDGG